MHEALHIFTDVLRNSVLITGLVIIMMLMIEYINVSSNGKWFSSLRQSRFGQIFLGALLGVVPGCVGGFATVSLYTHGLLSFGALIAMMIVSSGDEAFIMLAMIPEESLILFGILFVLGIVAGLLVDVIAPRKKHQAYCDTDFEIHSQDVHHHHHGEKCTSECPTRTIRNLKNGEWQRYILLGGIILFITALAFGLLEHEHAEEAHEHVHGLNIFDEYWINLLFAILSLFALWFTAVSDTHFIKEHLWDHVIKRHLLKIFCWTFGALLVVEIGLSFFDIGSWTKDNIPFMILLAVLIGIIPESGPHLLFVTLFASGAVPFSVLLASSISQDGHSSLPLLAETKKDFIYAKLINCAMAALVGYGVYLLGF
ncbi:MAG: arsenic efflux protein [Bacteroidales bacterium]|nr:arsenic efflux protein [Bacteroidales bacterium]